MSKKVFLQEFCSSLLDQYASDELKDLTIVIPSQRVALYIKEELMKLVKGSFWLPNIITINRFLEDLHDFVVVDELEAVFELYEAYHDSFDAPESFEDFLSWSSMIMADFNDIDKYLLEANQVFKNLQSIKDIESWSFNSDELSETQINFLKFWEQLGVLYHKFHSRLEERGEATNARVYRSIAEEPEKYLTRLKGQTYFIGFNALSKAEEKIMKFVVSAGLGEVCWDADEYYVTDDMMEAGKFIRKYSAWSVNSNRTTQNHLATDAKQIQLYEANSNLQQVGVASQLVSNLGESNLDDTAVVFADESLLKPMLNMLPADLKSLNVAMGYPLNAASVFSFFEEVVQVQVNIDRYKNKGFVYHNDFLQLVRHEVFQSYARQNSVCTASVEEKISKQNYAYLPLSLIEQSMGEDWNKVGFLFIKASDVAAFVEQVVAFFKEVYLLFEGDLLERESILALVAALEKVQVVQQKYGRIEQISTFNRLSKQLLRGLTVSFLGEPLEGLQMLGLLETRALDFKRVILLSCNEDVLPKRSFSNSLMPFDLRNYHGLPTRDDKEAIFAYYFYRLIQRAENVSLIYNGGEADGLKSNEISRYLLQVKEELSGEVSVEQVSVETVPEVTKVISWQESDRQLLQDRILRWFENGISASGMNQFNTCPKNFMYTQLLRLSQDEEIEEDIESSTYGTIVHEVLENLYRGQGTLIAVKEIDQMIKSYKDELKKSFDVRFPGGNYLSGKNLLLYETALHTIRKYLRAEKQLIQERGVIKVLGLEEKFEKTVAIQTSKGLIDLRIKGLIDRIDQIGDVIRIIDYKTGKVDKLKFNGQWEKVSSYQLQLMIYLYLFDSEVDVTCGMISFKELSSGFQQFEFGDKMVFERTWIESELKEEIEVYLQKFVEEVLASDFQHNPKSLYCTLC